MRFIVFAFLLLTPFAFAVSCPDGCLSLSCPRTTVSANNSVLASLILQDRQYCLGIGVSAVFANGSQASAGSYLGCPDGRANFSLVLPQSGRYVVAVAYNAVREFCTIDYFKPDLVPRLPDLPAAAAVAAAGVAALLYGRRVRAR